jgi:hypothetical protein
MEVEEGENANFPTYLVFVGPPTSYQSSLGRLSPVGKQRYALKSLLVSLETQKNFPTLTASFRHARHAAELHQKGQHSQP